MRLSAEDLRVLAASSMAAAVEAGKLITQSRGSDVKVRFKCGGESVASQVVTEIDELSQAVILKHLLPTCETYDLALLSEEQSDDGSRFEKEAFWCVDPLDGTLPFTEGIPGYAVSIALVARSGEPLIGVIYDPTTGVHYQAIKGQGVLRNGVAWRWPAAELDELQFIGDRSMQQHQLFDEVISRLEALVSQCGASVLGTHLTGGAVMNAMWVLERAPACYFKFPKPKAGGGSLWDYAATACLYAEVGAWCSDFYGRPLDLNRADSSFMNHRGVLFASSPELGRQLLELFPQKEPLE